MLPARASAQSNGAVNADPSTSPPMGQSRLLLKGGAVLTLDPRIGNFAQADVMIEAGKILEVRPNIEVTDTSAAVIDAAGMIVMPGFIDTHHHQFETALRSFLADARLFDDGTPHGMVNYADFVLGKFASISRPEDVYISELFGSLSQLDAGVTTVHDISQIHHTPEHSDAAIKGVVDAGRRTALAYSGDPTKDQGDARRIRAQYFSSDDQLVTMIVASEIGVPGYEGAWAVGRELNVPIASHVVGSLGMGERFDALAAAGRFRPDNLFIPMSGMSDLG